MTRATIAGGAIALVLVLLALAAGRSAVETFLSRSAAGPADMVSADAAPLPMPPNAKRGFLYARVSTASGAVYEGPLRWGGSEETLWGHHFNGAKKGNSWAGSVEPEQLKESRPFAIFGVELGERARPINLERPFMVRFGDIARIEASGRTDLRVVLKSGTVVELDRFEADDFADGVRIWDESVGVIDLPEHQLRTIQLLPHEAAGEVAAPLHGRVRTAQGDFEGLIQWNRRESIGSDALDGSSDEGSIRVRFDAIRSITRQGKGGAQVTLLDGRVLVLRQDPEVASGNRGLYVDDQRYGRVLVGWAAFERVDFSPASEVPGYEEFPPGGPLTGSVTTASGARHAGRLVFDLDESELVETLDSRVGLVNYTIPFGLIASVVLVPPGDGGSARSEGPVAVRLHSGEQLLLERSGDLAPSNAGMLIFTAADQQPEYVRWEDVGRMDFERPPRFYPPLDAATPPE